MASINNVERKLEALGFSQKTLGALLFQLGMDKAREWLRGAEDAEDLDSLEHYWASLDALTGAYEVYKEEMKL